eukprot:5783695-Ditylum_brightwellii.AAC.1
MKVKTCLKLEMAVAIWMEDDYVMPSDDDNKLSVEPFPRNGSENTINDCFDKIKNGVMLQTPFHEHAKVIN